MSDRKERNIYLKQLEQSKYPLWLREAIIAMCHYKRKKACKMVKKAIKRKETFDGEACYFVDRLFGITGMNAPDVPEYVIPGQLKYLEHKNDWLDASCRCGYAPARHDSAINTAQSLLALLRQKDMPDIDDTAHHLKEITSKAYYDAHPEVRHPEWCRYLEREDYYKFSLASGILLAAIPLDFLFCMKLDLSVDKGSIFVWYIVLFMLSLIGHCCIPLEENIKVSSFITLLTSLGLIVSEAWGTVRMVYHGYLYLNSPVKRLYLQGVEMWNGFPPNVQKYIGLGIVVLGCAVMVVLPLAMLISGMRNQNR